MTSPRTAASAKTTPLTREKPDLLLFDTATLSNFACAGQMDVLARRYRSRGRIVSEVLDEIDRGLQAGYSFLHGVYGLLEQRAFRELSLRTSQRRVFLTLLRNLGAGEAACIAAAMAHNAIVATDDRAARAVCREKGLRVTGTIGILKAACRDRMLSAREADDALARMIEGGFYSPVQRIREIL